MVLVFNNLLGISSHRTYCMSHQLPIPEPLRSIVPAEAQTALLDAWKSPRNRIAESGAQVRDFQARLQLNSTNSSKPPSSDPIGLKRTPPTPLSRRKRGGQLGHDRPQPQ